MSNKAKENAFTLAIIDAAFAHRRHRADIRRVRDLLSNKKDELFPKGESYILPWAKTTKAIREEIEKMNHLPKEIRRVAIRLLESL